MLVLVLMEEVLGDELFPQCSDGRQTLQCDGEVRIDWTTSYKNKNKWYVNRIVHTCTTCAVNWDRTARD